MGDTQPPKSDIPAADQEVTLPAAQPAQPPQAAEAKEKEPELSLTVARGCNNPDGRYVGLSGRQRDALKVAVGGIVELFENGQSLGLFTVGKGAAELTGKPEQFTSNVVEPGKSVTVKKADKNRETVMTFGVTHGVENVPANLQGEEAKKYADRTARRMQIIGERFPGVSTDEFMIIPTAVLNAMTGESVRIASISKQKIRFAGVETEMVVVPAGNDVGLTTKAAQKLKIPAGVTELRVRVERGVLVID